MVGEIFDIYLSEMPKNEYVKDYWEDTLPGHWSPLKLIWVPPYKAVPPCLGKKWEAPP